MKKFIIPVIAAAFVALFGLTACEEPILSPENTWCKSKVDVSGVKFDCWYIFCNEDYKPDDFIITEGLKPGLTLVIEDKTSNNKIYAYKTIAKGVNVEIDDDDPEDDEDNVKFRIPGATGTLWDGIYVYNRKTDSKFKDSERETLPDFLTDTSYINAANAGEEVESLLKNMSWKKLLKTIVNAL